MPNSVYLQQTSQAPWTTVDGSVPGGGSKFNHVFLHRWTHPNLYFSTPFITLQQKVHSRRWRSPWVKTKYTAGPHTKQHQNTCRVDQNQKKEENKSEMRKNLILGSDWKGRGIAWEQGTNMQSWLEVLDAMTQGVTNRCRLSQLSNSAHVYEPKCGGGVRVSANE